MATMRRAMIRHATGKGRVLWLFAFLAWGTAAMLTPAAADDQATLSAMSQRVRQLQAANNLTEAIRVARQALELAERLHGRRAPEASQARATLAALYRRNGQTAEAEEVEKAGRTPRTLAYKKPAPDADAARPLVPKATAEPRKVEPRKTDAAEPPPAPRAEPSPPRSVTMAPRPIAPAPGGAAPTSQPSPQLDPAKFASVPVFFGTNRRRTSDVTRNGVSLAAFGTEPQTNLQLGRALVSVPRQGRVEGTIPRPASATFWRAAEVEDPNKHFMLISLSLQDRQVFLQGVTDRLDLSKGDFKDQALVFVHGFNVNFEDAVYRTAQITFDLQFDGAPFLFSWPTPEGSFSYVGARDRAMASRRALREFLDMISQQTTAKRVHLIAHSMGTWPLLDVLREISEDDLRANKGQRFQEVVLAAPDMDRENFAAMASQICPAGPQSASRCAGGAARGMTVYATSNDRALLASVKLAGIDRAGLFDEKRPFLMRGIDTIDVSNADTSWFSYNHSQPLEREQLLADIALLMKHGSRPPDQRYKLFERRDTADGGAYWRYNKK
jgi:esterase/lipase superfamily enzyme